VPIGDPIDEGDLDAELESMEQEAIDERMLKTGTVPVADLPGVVANGPIKGKMNRIQHAEEDDEEEELRKLQAEMAM
jgi:charged multivesicular body protein 4A/B